MKYLIIGGGDRGTKYGRIIKKEGIGEVVAMADPVKKKRERMKIEHNIKEVNIFKLGEDALKKEKLSDAVIIATPDITHYKLAIRAMKKGYYVLLEKPMATTIKQCSGLVNIQEESDKDLTICHVLRYTPFFQKIKDIIESKDLGKVHNIDLIEQVGNWHFSHSYVRGNWRRRKNSGPIILTKSCHDMDILTWLVGSNVKTIESRGSLDFFKKENAAENAAERCINCEVENCPYDATKLYLEDKENEVKWPTSVISTDNSKKGREKALEKGNYGKCVWKSDNTVNDNQDVIIEFSNGIHANFRLRYGGEIPNRKIVIYCEKGKIRGDLEKGEIWISKYISSFRDTEIEKIELPKLKGHGGGDRGIMKNFFYAVKNNEPEKNLSDAKESLQSHLMAFAAAESADENKKIDFEKFINKFAKNKNILFY